MIAVQTVVEIHLVHLHGDGPQLIRDEINMVRHGSIAVALVGVDSGNSGVEFNAIGTSDRDVVEHVELAEIPDLCTCFQPFPRAGERHDLDGKLCGEIDAGIVTVIATALDVANIAVEVDLVNIVRHSNIDPFSVIRSG